MLPWVMRSIWRRVMAVWLAAVLVPSLLGGGACLSHLLGEAEAWSSHASHGAATAAHGADASQNAPVSAGHHAGHDAVAETSDAPVSVAAKVSANDIGDAAPHDCCPQQGAPEHCSGASGCTVAVSNHDERASGALRIVAALNRAPSPIAPPGPANAPDVPPPRA